MRAIILSAGQGSRLLPFTRTRPKCLLTVDGEHSMLEVQLRTLAQCGVTEATVMVGHGAGLVEQRLAERPLRNLEVRTVFNPFYKVTDNLITVWLAREMMDDDFILLNGDTLFDAPALERLLGSPDAPVTIAINEKDEYDADDMKVLLGGSRRLRTVGKTLDPTAVDGESIGLMLFRGEGVELFRNAVEEAVREQDALGSWYLRVIDNIAQRGPVETAAITGLWWGEVDSKEDLEEVRAFYEEREKKREPRFHLRAGALPT